MPIVANGWLKEQKKNRKENKTKTKQNKTKQKACKSS